MTTQKKTILYSKTDNTEITSKNPIVAAIENAFGNADNPGEIFQKDNNNYHLKCSDQEIKTKFFIPVDKLNSFIDAITSSIALPDGKIKKVTIKDASTGKLEQWLYYKSLKPKPDSVEITITKGTGGGSEEWVLSITPNEQKAESTTKPTETNSVNVNADNEPTKSKLLTILKSLNAGLSSWKSKAPPNIILAGPPGTGKTHLSDGIKDIVGEEHFSLIQFHPATTYEDFVGGLRPTDDGKFTYKPGHLAKICTDAIDDTQNLYCLWIDEINRANLPAVMGECIYALEHREKEVLTPYASLTIPNNILIIGTMNTADRSTGVLDYALRRRFAFIPRLPDPDKVTENNKKGFEAITALFTTNNISPDYNQEDVAIGHAFFVSDENAVFEWKYKVIPLLKEYIKDGIFSDVGKKAADTLIAISWADLIK